MYVIGIDPGPLPGIVRLQINSRRTGVRLDQAAQVTPDLLETVLIGITHDVDGVAVAMERFVVGQRAARSSTARAGAATRDMVGVVDAWAFRRGLPIHTRSAADVKPWATDERLDKAGLLGPTKGMRHARDAARHALFCAVKDFGLPDPLSRRGGTR